ncbi:hypothetical protein EDB92DRAFT_1908535 [Lactarius akahatsu]|uniref:Uncharacterized protein n=1 Tax=Lactarius akahatsu TaxID=416441 RepID=A0AAD4Q538_9AGAM|nr:hypothetical protein EDB92DRAFT_1908535 [Lactarius akahatsu]
MLSRCQWPLWFGPLVVGFRSRLEPMPRPCSQVIGLAARTVDGRTVGQRDVAYRGFHFVGFDVAYWTSRGCATSLQLQLAACPTLCHRPDGLVPTDVY